MFGDRSLFHRATSTPIKSKTILLLHIPVKPSYVTRNPFHQHFNSKIDDCTHRVKALAWSCPPRGATRTPLPPGLPFPVFSQVHKRCGVFTGAYGSLGVAFTADQMRRNGRQHACPACLSRSYIQLRNVTVILLQYSRPATPFSGVDAFCKSYIQYIVCVHKLIQLVFLLGSTKV